jgi:aminomethyltransferase
VWDALVEAGRPVDLRPAGLGARDTLRLEAAMRLYGNDIDETTTVLEAGLEWIVSWTKGDFIGREALAAQKAAGIPRRLVGFEVHDRAIARHGYPVVIDNEPVGVVTSGTQTPFLKKPIGMAYVPASVADDADIAIDIRNRRVPARLVPLPFYKRPRK